MSYKEPTNHELAEKIDRVATSVKKLENKMASFHDFMIVQQDREVRKPNGNINWQRLLEKGIILLTVAASTVYLLVEFVVKRAS